MRWSQRIYGKWLSLWWEQYSLFCLLTYNKLTWNKICSDTLVDILFFSCPLSIHRSFGKMIHWFSSGKSLPFSLTLKLCHFVESVPNPALREDPDWRRPVNIFYLYGLSDEFINKLIWSEANDIWGDVCWGSWEI